MMKRESCGGWAGPSTAPSPPARVGGMLAWRAAPRPGAAGPALPVFGAVCLNFRQMLFAKFAAGSGAFAGSSAGCAPWSCSRPRAALRRTVRAVSTATEGQCPALPPASGVGRHRCWDGQHRSLDCCLLAFPWEGRESSRHWTT